MSAAIAVRNLTKRYGSLEAVRGIDFQVQTGEVFGLLGPNGAGKTTTIEILEGLRPRSGGDIEVLGFDPNTQTQQLKDRIGVCLQATNLPDKIQVVEAIELFSGLYSRHVDAEPLLRRLQLWEKRKAYYAELSGGQKQRLALAIALLNDPQLLFLDEPTAGLDPQARLEIRELVDELRREKRTIMLTTHYIEEAERLCARVAVIDEGRIVALGSPRELQAQVAATSTIEIFCEQGLDGLDLQELPHAERASLSEDRKSLTVTSARPAAALVELVKRIDQEGIELTDIRLKRPTLEDAFIELTGKMLRE